MIPNRDRTSLSRVKPLLDLRPVYNVPPSGEVLGSAVLILQVICVFPNVHAHHREFALHQRTVLIRRGYDVDLATALHQPRPPRAKPAHTRGVHFFLELIEAPESTVDGLPDVARRIAARLGSHNLPEHAVVDMTASVVTHRGPNVLRDDRAVV